MFTIIGLMLTGMLLGYLLRKRSLHKIHTVITVLIWALLFILGIEVGGNEQIIKGLHPLMQSLIARSDYIHFAP